MNKQKQFGYTLIEVMVAAALGVLLLGIVVTIYLGSKSTFRAAEGLARSQESTRFAMHFLKRDIRGSGYQGCSKGVSRRNFMNDQLDNFPLSEDNAIFGWEFNGTEYGDNYDLEYTELDSPFTQAELTDARDDNSVAGTNWVGRYIEITGDAPINKNLPAAITALRPLLGSDIISVTSSEVVPNLKVGLQTNSGNPVFETIDENEDDRESGVETGTIVKISDCSASDTFQNAAAADEESLSALPGAGVPGNLLTGAFKWQKKWDKNAEVYRSITKIYFIGTGAGGKPSLYVYESDCGIGGDCGTTSELIEGVENMQILYGEDTVAPDENSANANLDQDEREDLDGVVDSYFSANDVTDFRNVLDVKIGLLVRSPDAALDLADNPSYTLLNQIEITPPNDRRQRFVNNATVRLHNRGL